MILQFLTLRTIDMFVDTEQKGPLTNSGKLDAIVKLQPLDSDTHRTFSEFSTHREENKNAINKEPFRRG